MKKTYYFPNGEFNDEFFGGSDAICVDRAQIKWLAEEWGMSFLKLMSQMHEATAAEIAEYGVYDS